jgi:hypothetical protein
MAAEHPQHSERASSSQPGSAAGTSAPPALLSLPAPSDNQASISRTQTVKLDALGPMVINSDGTLSRIHNWAEMTDAERERTLRILGKRNQLRKETILAAEGDTDGCVSHTGP